MRFISIFLPCLVFAMVQFSLIDMDMDSITNVQISIKYVVYALPLILLTMYYQYKHIKLELSFFRKITLLIPGLTCLICACGVWAMLIIKQLPYSAFLFIGYLFFPSILGKIIYIFTEERESKKMIIKTIDNQEYTVSLKDYSENQDYICIRQRDKVTGDVYSVTKVPRDKISGMVLTSDSENISHTYE